MRLKRDSKNNRLSNLKVSFDPDESCFMARVKSLIRICSRDKGSREEAVSIDSSIEGHSCQKSREVEKNLEGREVRHGYINMGNITSYLYGDVI